MLAIDRFGELGEGWAGPGTLRPRAPAIKAARRVMQDRQAIATRLTPSPLPDGGVAISFNAGADGAGAPGHVHIDRHGRPAIIDGPAASDAPEEPRYKGVTDGKFKKALSALVSPSTGRIRVNRIELDGIVFDSEVEARRYGILTNDVRSGRITDLRLQVPYEFHEGGRLCFTYIADFVYVENGAEVVEDVKGMRLDVYILKKKLIEARYGITITEWPISRKELARRALAEQRRIRDQAAAAAKEERRLERERKREERERAEAEKAALRANRAAPKARPSRTSEPQLEAA